MPRTPSKYFWPASAITAADMQLLYRARENSAGHEPISRLLARAVRETYGPPVAASCTGATQPKDDEGRKS